MGWFDDIITGGMSGAIGGIANWFGQDSANRANRDISRDTNAFNERMMRENQSWQERMSNTSWQRGVADMRAAGINPMLAFSKGGASTPTGGAASGNAIPMQNTMTGVTPAISSAIGVAKLKSELENLKSTNAKIDSDSALNRQLIETSKTQAALNSSSAVNALASANRSHIDAANMQTLLQGLSNRQEWDKSVIGRIVSSMKYTMDAINPLASLNFLNSANALKNLNKG